MERAALWSLRLGFSGKQQGAITVSGIDGFLKKSFDAPYFKGVPDLLADSPKSLADLRMQRQKLEAGSTFKKELVRKEIRTSLNLKAWWISQMMEAGFPLREKMTGFWANHFVSTFQKVKVNHWLFAHNQLLRENAFGNFRELTKKVLHTNAMVRYLDNTDNRAGNLNENLSRELLELFTLGIGNYSEDDIKQGAKALAGLGIGPEDAVYRPRLRDQSAVTYLGKTGRFDADDLVNIIFSQPSAPYRITKKILQWFIYDDPDEKLVRRYGDYFREQDFEIAPLLTMIFTQEFEKDNAGSKIKDPLTYIIQLTEALNIENPNTLLMAVFLKQQGMDLFNQPNVKGWNGGHQWLTSQIYLQRNNVADLLCNGRNLARRVKYEDIDIEDRAQTVRIDWKKGNNRDVIAALSGKLLFQAGAELHTDMETLLRYDFNPDSPGADNAVMRLFNYIVKTPEFQIV